MRTPLHLLSRSFGVGLWLAAGLVHASLDAEGAARLAALQHDPQAAGEQVYQGHVFALDPSPGPPLFTYERRVRTSTVGLTAAHVTREPGGSVVIVESAQVDGRYGLRAFEAVNAQLGHRGSVALSDDGRRLRYQLVENGVTSTATEEVTAPVVSGPSLHGFILQRWDTLAPGVVVPVRMVVLAEKRTYGFDIALAGQGEGRTTFSVTPSSWLVRLAVAPLTVTFDDRTRHVVRYEGRVPPTVLRDGRRKALDARVVYTPTQREYR